MHLGVGSLPWNGCSIQRRRHRGRDSATLEVDSHRHAPLSGFGAILVLTLAVAAGGYFTLLQVEGQVQRMEATSQLDDTLAQATQSRLTYLFTRDASDLEQNEAHLARLEQDIENARALNWQTEEAATLNAMARQLAEYRLARDVLVERYLVRLQARAD